MTILKVAKMGHPILRQLADPLPDGLIAAPEIQRFIDDMIETMIDYDGVGLAAPQVHRALRLFVMEVPETSERYGENEETMPLTVVINPEFSPLGDNRIYSMEGCLSIPQILGLVPRHHTIRVRYQDRTGKLRDGEFSGFPAIVFQHEYDHLDGVLYLDRMESMESLTFRREYQRYGSAEE